MADFFSNLDINKLVGGNTSPNLGWDPYQTGNSIPTGSGRVDNLPSAPSASDPASMMQEQLNQQNQTAQPSVSNPNAPHGEVSTPPTRTMRDIDLSSINYNRPEELNNLISVASDSVDVLDKLMQDSTINKSMELDNSIGESGVKFMLSQFNADGSMGKSPMQLAESIANISGQKELLDVPKVAQVIKDYAKEYNIPQVAVAAILNQHLGSTGRLGINSTNLQKKGGTWVESDIGFNYKDVKAALANFSNNVKANTKGDKVQTNEQLSNVLKNYIDRYNTNLSYKKAQVGTINEAREIQKYLSLQNSRKLSGSDLTPGEYQTLGMHIQLLKKNAELNQYLENKLRNYLSK